MHPRVGSSVLTLTPPNPGISRFKERKKNRNKTPENVAIK